MGVSKLPGVLRVERNEVCTPSPFLFEEQRGYRHDRMEHCSVLPSIAAAAVAVAVAVAVDERGTAGMETGEPPTGNRRDASSCMAFHDAHSASHSS